MIPWITSAGTLLAVWLTGRNLRLSWKVSLANQGMWLVFIISYKAWGLLPLTLALAGIFARHLWTTRDALANVIDDGGVDTVPDAWACYQDDVVGCAAVSADQRHPVTAVR